MPLWPLLLVAAVVVITIGITAVRRASAKCIVINPVSSAIVVAAGCALVVAGGYHTHGDTSLFLTLVGCFIGGTGLVTWIGAGYRYRNTPVGND